MKKLLLYACLFFVGTIALAQEKDVLLDEADELIEKVRSKELTEEAAFTLAHSYLKKAQQAKRNELIGRAYFMFAIKSSDIDKRLQYIDSAIHYTENLKDDPSFPYRLYMYKGFTLYRQNDYEQALDYFILAESAAELNNNINSQYNVKFNIALIKRLLGAYDEAEALFIECKKFNESRDDMSLRNQFKILFQLSSIYYETQNTKEGTIINKQGILLSKAHDNEAMYYSFVVNQGINLNIKGDYEASIDSLEKGYPKLTEDDQQVAGFYLGKSYYALGKKEKALNYFKKIDTVFNQTNELYPPLIAAYEYLINDSKYKKDKESQLYYTEQLLKVDSILDRNYKYLINTIFNKHDVPRYLSERDDIIDELQKKNRLGKIILIVSILLGLLALGGLLYYYRLKILYKKRYEAIMEKSKGTIKEEITVKNAKPQVVSLGIDQHIIEEILQALELFEQGEAYLENQISLKDVAKIINTNSKYLSKIVNSYKGKNFTTYINDLRIEYLVSHVQHDTKYQKYTIRAIAEEVGFSNPEGFSRAFQKNTGLKPSYFIKKVRENTEKKQ